MKLKIAKQQRRARIEIVPLIDIMFFLLATFVMVSTSMIKNRGISVNLPKAASGAQEERKDYVTLSVSKDGLYYLDRDVVAKESLPESLQTLKQQRPDTKVFINGDKEATVEALIGALDEVRKAGITKVALETEAKK